MRDSGHHGDRSAVRLLKDPAIVFHVRVRACVHACVRACKLAHFESAVQSPSVSTMSFSNMLSNSPSVAKICAPPCTRQRYPSMPAKAKGASAALSMKSEKFARKAGCESSFERA